MTIDETTITGTYTPPNINDFERLLEDTLNDVTQTMELNQQNHQSTIDLIKTIVEITARKINIKATVMRVFLDCDLLNVTLRTVHDTNGPTCIDITADYTFHRPAHRRQITIRNWKVDALPRS